MEVITDYNQQQYSLIINSSSIKIIRTNVMILSELLLEVMWILVHMIILSELWFASVEKSWYTSEESYACHLFCEKLTSNCGQILTQDYILSNLTKVPRCYTSELKVLQ